MSTELTAYEPRNLGELEQFAGRVTRTGLVPTAYKNKPDDAMVAMMYGKECAGLGPLISLQSIAVINGKPAFYGDAMPGIAFNKGMIRDMEETFEGKPYDDDFAAVCIVTRPSGSKVTQRFSVADAKRALLWNKQGPWTQYPQRMLQWRARSWAIRDAAPHLLFGPSVEELQEQPHIGADRAVDITPANDRAAERRAAMEELGTVEVVDAYGTVVNVMPGEVEAWAKAQLDGATPEQIEELAANNPGVELFQTPPEPAKPAARTIPMLDVDGQVSGTYLNATEWVDGLEMTAKTIPGLVEANWAYLTRIATHKDTPAALREKAQKLRDSVGDGREAA